LKGLGKLFSKKVSPYFRIKLNNHFHYNYEGEEHMTLPLDGIRVLDLSRLLPGPFCSWILADFGAEVIRVEEPLKQTTGRRAELSQGVTRRAIFTTDPPSEVRPYDCLSRNKKSIIINLKDKRGQAIVQQIASQMDIFLEEFRPGVVKRLGVDYETIKKINPRIIYCSISLYGQDGPYHHLPGHDPCALSVAGAIGLSNAEGEKPKLFGVPVADVLTGLHAIVGILLALRVREATGKGQYIDISMLDSSLDLLCLASQPYFRKGTFPKISRKNPSSAVWETKDGKYICTTNIEAHHWANFCRILGREDFIPYQYDRAKREFMYDEIQKIFLTKTRDEWLQLLQGDAETQASPIHHNLDQVFSDPQVLHRQMMVTLNHPKLGIIKQLGMSIKLSESPGQIRHLAPLPGEHTEEILTQLGYNSRDINALRKEGVLS
jgi:crotonobetainyl-CoA:carnitine CoA-transferase CaiB-like acyl-CoA transferase